MNLDSIWRLFGSLYRATMKAAAEQTRVQLETDCISLIGVFRDKSGLAPAKSLYLIVALRDALNTVIDREKKGPN